MKKFRLMSREQIKERLKQLNAMAEPPTVEGAMCYSMSKPPDRAEYICPKCGEKTLYSGDQAHFVARGLEKCRRQFEIIKASTDISITLDESSYCGKCSPEATAFQLELIVTYEDGTTIKSSPISEWDLLILRDFFKGEDVITTDCDDRFPLKTHTFTLDNLLLGPMQNNFEAFVEFLRELEDKCEPKND